jgi:predicted transcriptional regulator
MQLPTAEELRTARKRRGLTQGGLADRAGVSQPLIARIESGDVDTTLDTLHSIVAALNDSESSVAKEKIEVVVPKALKTARERANYTQSELADETGLSQPLVSRVERGDVNPRVSTLRTLLEPLDFPQQTTIQDSESPDHAATSGAASPGGVLEQIENEFEMLRNSADTTAESQSRRMYQCPDCAVPLDEYPDPKFCPECGTELNPGR